MGALSCSGDWNEQNSAWSHSRKRGGFGWQAGEGGDILGNLPLGQPADVADDGWVMGEPVQEKQNLWDKHFFGQPETCRRQPVTRFVAFAFAFWRVVCCRLLKCRYSLWKSKTRLIAEGCTALGDKARVKMSFPFTASNVKVSVRSPFDPRSDALMMESEDHLDLATVAKPRFMW